MTTAGKPRILVVEDEKHLAEGLVYNLRLERYEPVLARDGREALDLLREGPWSLILLDLMLPQVDGFEVARRVRQDEPRIPILMLTAKASEEDRVRGLECGADDYLTKPFHLRELLLRIQGILKRSSWYRTLPGHGSFYRFGKDCWIDFRGRRSGGPRGERPLTEKEFGVMKALVESQPETVPREEMLEKVWGYSSDVETRTLDNFVRRLRNHFEPDPAKPSHILSVRGLGYRFVP